MCRKAYCFSSVSSLFFLYPLFLPSSNLLYCPVYKDYLLLRAGIWKEHAWEYTPSELISQESWKSNSSTSTVESHWNWCEMVSGNGISDKISSLKNENSVIIQFFGIVWIQNTSHADLWYLIIFGAQLTSSNLMGFWPL